MSEYMFGLGSGHLPKKVARMAEKHDATLVNHVDPDCKCGWGCSPYDCPRSKRHWFSTDNYGEPHNSEVRRAVFSELKEMGLF